MYLSTYKNTVIHYLAGCIIAGICCGDDCEGINSRSILASARAIPTNDIIRATFTED